MKPIFSKDTGDYFILFIRAMPSQKMSNWHHYHKYSKIKNERNTSIMKLLGTVVYYLLEVGHFK